MFFLTQLKELSDFFAKEDYFYDRTVVESTFAEIAGASSFEVARTKFEITCDDLQIVLKFVVGFLDYDVYLDLEGLTDQFSLRLFNKPLLVKSSLHTMSQGIQLKIDPPEEDETPADARERQSQLMVITRIIDRNKFNESAARLTGNCNYPRIQRKQKENTEICDKIKVCFNRLDDLRKFLGETKTAASELITVSPPFVAEVVKTKTEVLNSITGLRTSIDILRTNLQRDEYSITMPEYDGKSDYLRKAQSIDEGVPKFMSLLSSKFPDKRCMYVVSEQLKKDNHYNLIRELNILYLEQLKYILEFRLLKDKFENKDVLDKQKNKNIAKFNSAFKKAVEKFENAVAFFSQALPVSFRVPQGFQLMHETSSDLAIVAENLAWADLPEQGNLKIILVNEDQVVLAHAEIAFHIVTLYEYLRNTIKAFRKIKILSKDDIDLALQAANKNKILLQETYANVMDNLLGNTYSLERNQQLVLVKTLISHDIVLRLLIITNKVFAINHHDYIKIKATLKCIASVNKKIAIANARLKEFADSLAELMARGFKLQEFYTRTAVQVVEAVAIEGRVRKAYPVMTEVMQLTMEKLVERAAQLKKYFDDCPKVDDSNHFDIVEKNLTQIFMDAKNILEKLGEIRTSFANNPHRLQLSPSMAPIAEEREAVRLSFI
jgi:hypothetical protein